MLLKVWNHLCRNHIITFSKIHLWQLEPFQFSLFTLEKFILKQNDKISDFKRYFEMIIHQPAPGRNGCVWTPPPLRVFAYLCPLPCPLPWPNKMTEAVSSSFFTLFRMPLTACRYMAQEPEYWSQLCVLRDTTADCSPVRKAVIGSDTLFPLHQECAKLLKEGQLTPMPWSFWRSCRWGTESKTCCKSK